MKECNYLTAREKVKKEIKIERCWWVVKKVSLILLIAVFLVSMNLYGCTTQEATVSDESLTTMFSDAGFEANVNEFPKARDENFPIFCVPDQILTCDKEEIFIFSYENCNQYIDELIARDWKVYYKENLLLTYGGQNTKIIDILKENFHAVN